jgi:DNA modification methylase
VNMIAVFREVRRVLKGSGTVWLNLGDTYAGEKQLMGVPWRVALALQADGWYLRSDIIWAKPSPMPESIRDRPTRAHEYIFLLTASPRYFYDAKEIAEKALSTSGAQRFTSRRAVSGMRLKKANGNEGKPYEDQDKRGGTRNKRTVWTVATTPTKGAHYATMPEQIVEHCILAGCPIGGVVLDPFVGSGTVIAVAQRLGRRGVGTDLSYQDLAKERTAQQGLWFGDEETT